jgi:hypothetical protein
MRRLGAADIGLTAIAVALWVGLLVLLPSEMSPDGWYAFLGGDVIVHHGLPSHDTLTVWGHGRRWVDQQWLAQLTYYGLYALGGLRLALLVNAAIVAGSFTWAARLGGARRGVLWVPALGAIALGLGSSTLRPQTLILPLFVALTWLLLEDARVPSRRVFWAIPLLVVWANLHGTVTVGVLLVLLAVAADAWPRRRTTRRTTGLAVLAVASLFASPYALHLTGYYRTVLFSREFAKYLPDWMPTALSPATAAFYLLAFAAVFTIARAPRALTLFERSALVVLLVLAVEASRGVTWFTLFAIVVLPGALPAWRVRVPAVAAVVLPVAAVAALVGAASRPSSWFGRDYPSSSARVVADSAGAKATVFASARFNDWLLLRQPSLRGRLAYDARYELLPHGRLADAVHVSIGRYDAERILRPFGVVVLRPGDTELRGTLERTGQWRQVAAGTKLVVLRRVTA